MTIRHFLLLFCLFLIISCKWLGKKDPQQSSASVKVKPSTQMPIPAMPVLGDYADDWKIVDSLERQGLFKSALEKVESIQARAKNDKNGQQIVKSLIFRGKYMTQLEEDGLVKAINSLEGEMKTTHNPEKALLQSMLGQLYATYLQSNGWNLNQRTPIPDGEGGDILTWSAAQIEKHALNLYIASITESPAMLKETQVDYFRDVLNKGENDSIQGKPLRPTLYDFLCNRALEHFTNGRSYLTEPAYVFALNQPEAFLPRTEFIKAAFETKDSVSGIWLSTKTFQAVLNREKMQVSSAGGTRKEWIDTAAVVDADLHRLQFAFNNSTLEDKESRYQQALQHLLDEQKGNPIASEVAYALAAFKFGLDHDQAENARSAVAICEGAIKKYPKTFGANRCSQLLAEIKAPLLTSVIEQVNLPEKPVLVQVGFKNIPKVWVRVVKGDFDEFKWNYLTTLERIQVLKNKKPLQSKTWDIQDPGDYQSHSTEIALQGLPLGSYWVLLSHSGDFESETADFVYSRFSISNIAAVSYNENYQTQFILAHRQTGAPLQNVTLNFYQIDYNTNPATLKLSGSTVTSKEGFAKCDAPRNQSVQVRAILGKDTLNVGTAYNYTHNESNEYRPEVTFFTDRAMYRPGQTVYFKGLVFRQKDQGKQQRRIPEIVPNLAVTVAFYDANGQPKGELKLKSNEYGTFNGSFTAPATGLTGQMSIQAINGAQGQTYFNVEEYKRPRFEVTTKPVEGAFRVNDKITVRGEAKNYAGNAVDGAALTYRVVRVARFPYWDYYRSWKRPSYFNSDEMEITSGEATTDADGAFSVEFTAIPDVSIPKKDLPIFDYQVFVEVTDITGETQRTNTMVSAGYVALKVRFDLEKEINIDSLKHITLVTTNMADQKQGAVGQITVQKLVEPKQVYLDRMWERPEITTIGKSEFERMFPDFAWKDEDNPLTWEKEGAARIVQFNTDEGSTVNLGTPDMKPGYYQVKLTTKDAFGEKVEIERIVRVWDQKSQFVNPSAMADKASYEPGETAKITLGSRFDELYFFFAQENYGKIQQPEWVSSQVKNLSNIELKIQENDRGGIIAHYFAIKNNRIYGEQPLHLNVPWSNKDLKISYETFRDKLAPGQKEEWRIKISGPKKEKVAAEMVAAMYDASLDQFRPNDWTLIRFPHAYANINFARGLTFQTVGGMGGIMDQGTGAQGIFRQYPSLNWFDFPMWGNPYRGNKVKLQGVVAEMSAAPAMDGAGDINIKGSRAKATNYYIDGVRVSDTGANELDKSQISIQAPPPASIRRNLNETVFFFPELRTDADGNVVLKFTMNEALTRWKLLTFAHTKELQQAISVKEVVTQKELMVIANPPRFLREGDEIEFSAKVSNLSKELLTGTATLNLLDAATLAPVEREFGLAPNNRIARFSVQPGQSGAVSWRIQVPDGYNGAVTWQIYADAKAFRDGEESTIPVVTNRMLVTESLPISVRGNQTKKFVFDNLKNSNSSNTLKSHAYTLEFTSNPAWFAVQSLPYLMEYPHECSEQVFSRFYANTLASSVVEKMPQIKRVFDRWKGTDAMKSNLSKNQELKYALLEETPWVMAAQGEEQQKQNIALLFDLNRMSNEQERAMKTLAERQLGTGGWPWFPGGQDSWYITQYIVSGMKHLQKLGAFDPKKDQSTVQMVDKAIGYCDAKIAEQYRKLLEDVGKNKARLDDDHLDGMVIQYLYVKSFAPVDRPSKELGYYLGQAAKYWLGKGIYQEGMLALALNRFGNKEVATQIVNSLRERATVKDELGMYWPVDWGFYWYQLPIETQALMVEVFGEVANDTKAVEDLRIWLLKNKQTNRWESTKATAEAVYSLLLFGDNWLDNTKPVQVSMGDKPLKVNEYEPGTGYFKQTWNGADIKKSWSEIKVENPNSNIVWGAAYWQYFEDLDKIQDFKKTPLTIVKQLFLEENSPTGPVLKPIAEGQSLKRGDKIKVRIEIRVDRAMEFVHLKDMRAAGFEPVNVLSGYRWQGGLGYYESTKDLATHFFIDYLPRGTFVFEYPMVVSLRGDMSNGITTMQCMYAPEFTSHSKGIRVKVE